ncbi:MAG: DNA glycosylase [Firmicutes bacterium]|nr:DNA glycosylase [Bacillota bacterium]
MILKNENLNLAAIAESGQCFRWRTLEDGTMEITAFSRVLHARQTGEDVCDFDCDQGDFDSIWRSYLDLDTDYGAVIRRIPKEDAYLNNAAAFGRGIRILRQDPFETLITFTISQRKNIPAIRQAVEKICALAGKPIPGTDRYAFPGVRELAARSLEDLLSCSLGYRAKYLYGQAQRFVRGEVTAEGLASCSDEALKEALLALPGVGIKVANCTMLFGFHRVNCFPVDVWMNRIQARHYPDGYPLGRWAPFAGIYQQYLFAFARAGEER